MVSKLNAINSTVVSTTDISERRWPVRGADRDLALSVQVLQEFYVQATRASRPDAIGHSQAVRLIESFRRFQVQDITSGVMMAALDARQRFQLSYWDAAIIEASRVLGCTQVLSEDRTDGRDYAGVRVTNPFREA